MHPRDLIEGKNWKCPYCGHAQVLLKARIENAWEKIRNDYSILGEMASCVSSIVCSNEECKNITISLNLYRRVDDSRNYNEFDVGEFLYGFDLLPESSARPQPDFIPAPIINDYYEACRIRDLSPKASATLSRRCLQGMIRDFCGISRKTLDLEIKALQALIDEGKSPKGVHDDTTKAIDHVRKVGNIGAHMEADINLIVDVDPDEAQLLIDLIEMLFEEWYVAKKSRSDKLEKLAALAAEKAAAKLPAPPKALPAPDGTDRGNEV